MHCYVSNFYNNLLKAPTVLLHIPDKRLESVSSSPQKGHFTNSLKPARVQWELLSGSPCSYSSVSCSETNSNCGEMLVDGGIPHPTESYSHLIINF